MLFILSRKRFFNKFVWAKITSGTRILIEKKSVSQWFSKKKSRSKKVLFSKVVADPALRGPRRRLSKTKPFLSETFFFKPLGDRLFFNKYSCSRRYFGSNKLIKKNVFLTIWTALFMQLGITIFMCLIWLEEFTSWCEWEIIVLDWEDQTFAKQEISMKQMICQACVFGNFYHYQKEFGTKNCFWKFSKRIWHKKLFLKIYNYMKSVFCLCLPLQKESWV